MIISDYPERLTGTVKNGSFVLLTLDIAASIREVTDETAIREAEALPRAKCLAWIYLPSSSLGSRLPHWTFFLAGRRLPAAPHSFAAVPIAPNTPHPETGRAAVEPSLPFPWPDCFMHTLDDITVPISRLYEPSDSGIVLDTAQRRSFLRAWYADMDATAEEQLAEAVADGIAIPVDAHAGDSGGSGTSSGHGSASRSVSSSQRVSGDESSEHESSARGPASHEASDCSTSGDSSSRGALAAHLDAHDPEPEIEDHGIVLYVQVSGVLDPSVEFGTVDDFLAVQDRLAQIEEERAERAVKAHLSRAAAPKTTAWLQGISAAGELEDVSPEAAAHHPPLQDEPSVPAAPVAELESAQGPVVSPAARDETCVSIHSPDRTSQQDSSGLDRSSPPTPLPQPAPIVSPTSTRPSLPHQPSAVSVAASVPESAPPPPTIPEAADNSAAAEGVPSKSGPPIKKAEGAPAEGSSRPWTLRLLLSLLISRLRGFIARCRAFFF